MATDGAPRADMSLGGRYRLTRQVGAGGMGVVFEAINTWTSRRVAIKCLTAQAVDGRAKTLGEDQVERFMQEARATAQVKHPHVVDVLDMGRDEASGTLFIVYEFLEGESLRARLDREGRLSPAAAAAALLPVMDAMAAVHAAGVVHRDLKPENLFLAREGERTVPKVIDFGIARALDDHARVDLTRTGTALGTPRYMAPEQCRGAKELDARVDVWSLGAVWFEALTGRAPYPGDGYHEVLAAILTSDAPAVRSLRPEVPEALGRAVDRALARDRERRHATMAAFASAVRGATEATAAPIRAGRGRRVAAAAAAGALALGAALTWRAQPRAAAVAAVDAGAAAAVVAVDAGAVVDATARAADVAAVARDVTALAEAGRRVTARAAPRGLRDAGAAPTAAPAVNGAPLLEP